MSSVVQAWGGRIRAAVHLAPAAFVATVPARSLAVADTRDQDARVAAGPVTRKRQAIAIPHGNHRLQILVANFQGESSLLGGDSLPASLTTRPSESPPGRPVAAGIQIG